uniref:G_PROTEIN_RECEP_F1_2 domain-containing protein n=1 Tax=Panagrellus redivivus TaxID=6233 RepID=A0A7E4VE23_PANRE
MVAQTTTIETVTVVRPLKIISLLCFIANIVLLIVAISSVNWIKTDSFHIGLWEECADNTEIARMSPVPGAPPAGTCHKRRSAPYITAVTVLSLIALFGTAFAAIANIVGLIYNDPHRKHLFYKIATYLALLMVLLELICVIIFPVCFFVRMSEFGTRTWKLDWGYGLDFCATLFMFVAVLLLICDKEHDEVYYKEKTVYNPPTEFA